MKNYKKYKVQFTRYSYALSTYLRCTFFLVLIYVVSCKLYFVLNSMHVRMATNSSDDSSQMLNSFGAVLVIFMLRNLNS